MACFVSRNESSDRLLEGLRVVDASIMPDCVRANTNVTTMMIGERVADFIHQGT